MRSRGRVRLAGGAGGDPGEEDIWEWPQRAREGLFRTAAGWRPRPRPPGARVLRRLRCLSTRVASADFCSLDTALHVVEHMVQDVLGARAGDAWDPLNPRPSSRPPTSKVPQTEEHWGTLRPGHTLRCLTLPHPVTTGHIPRSLTEVPGPSPTPPDRRFTPMVSPAPGSSPPLATTSRSACRLARSGPLGPRSGKAESELGQTSSWPRPPRLLRLWDGLRLGSPAARGRLYGRSLRGTSGNAAGAWPRRLKQGCCCGCISRGPCRGQGQAGWEHRGVQRAENFGLQSFELRAGEDS